jgi:prepilin-type N-terminal cleavage/methylation domain-containing protein
MSKPFRGFTLVEVLVVTVILSMLMALALASLRSHIQRARLVQALNRVEHADRLGRTLARRDHRSQRLVLDRERGIIELQPLSNSIKPASRHRWRLPAGITLETVLDEAGVGQGDRHEVVISSNGISASYAVALRAADLPPRWLVTLGLSGQQLRLERQADVDSMFPR